MKKKLFVSIIISTFCLIWNISLFSMNESNEKLKRNFLIKRFERPFNLEQICKEHSEEALHCYYLAIDDFKDLENKIPQELLELVRNVREFSHINIHPIKPKSLVEICAVQLARRSITDDLIASLRGILFSAKMKGWYDAKLAQLIIKFYLNDNYKASQKQLDRSILTAAAIGDPHAVSLLLEKGANVDFVNSDNGFTPLAYALRIELKYSHSHRLSKYNTYHKYCYELIANFLIRAGAKVDHQIRIQDHSNFTHITYIFMQTNNVRIFNLFEKQIIDKAELTDNTNCNIVINAFKLGSAKFIKRLYANSLYRNSAVARNGGKTFSDLAIKYYKGYDFIELFEFLKQSNEITLNSTLDLNTFGYACYINIVNGLDYKAFNNFAELRYIQPTRIFSNGDTLLIDLIKRYRPDKSQKNLILFIETLQKYNVNFFHKNNTGKAALEYAQENQLTNQILQALMITPLIHEITKSPDDNRAIKLIRYLSSLKPKCEINTYKDSKGKTALYYAQELNRNRIVEALMAYTISNLCLN